MTILTSGVGRIGKDAVTRTAGSDKVTGFSLAMDNGFGDKKQTHWVDCAYWGAGGKAVSQYLTKGQTVVVSGEVSLTPASDKYAAKISVRVNSLTLAGGRRDSQDNAASAPKPAQAAAATFDAGDDIPF